MLTIERLLSDLPPESETGFDEFAQPEDLDQVDESELLAVAEPEVQGEVGTTEIVEGTTEVVLEEEV